MSTRHVLNFPRILTRLAGIALGGVFIWAGIAKISDPGGFAVAIGNYRLLPAMMVPAVAVVLPWVELGCGTLLVAGRRIAAAALTVDILLIIFVFGLAANRLRGIDVNCGCFSLAAKASAHVVLDIGRDAAFLALGLWVLIAEWRENGGPHRLPGSPAGL